MSCTIRFNHSGWDVLTDRWSAGSDNQHNTQVRYIWTGGESMDSVATLKVSFNVFANYIAACMRHNEIADLRDENLEKISEEYKQPVNYRP